MKIHARKLKTNAQLVIVVLISITGSTMNAQTIDLDSLDFTTAKVALIEHQNTPCHVSTSSFTFKVVKHISGPKIEKDTIITSLLLRGDINGDATKISNELYDGFVDGDEGNNELIINFTYNSNPKSRPTGPAMGCNNSPYYFDYGISYIRWAVREDRQRDMLSLDYFLDAKFNKKFHLLPEREGKFPFEHNGKRMLAFRLYNEWELAEIKPKN